MLLLLFSSIFAESIVEIINNNPASTWVAVEYHPSIIPKDFSPGNQQFFRDPSPWEPEIDSAVPGEFSAREQWGDLIHPARNQLKCGGCWAFSVAEAFGDALGVAGCPKGEISVQYLLSCDKVNKACKGGQMFDAQQFLVDTGAPTDECLPYASYAGEVPSCPAKCQNGSALHLHKLKSWRKIEYKNARQTIFDYGPISGGFYMMQDFKQYSSGVYMYQAGDFVTAHAILVIGWGVEDGLPYWLVQNSWGPEWGLNGHFKILRGYNHCYIEEFFSLGEVQC